jgi:pyruvate,orthophosphate dikinase
MLTVKNVANFQAKGKGLLADCDQNSRRRSAEGRHQGESHEVMIPLVGFKKELDLQAELVHRVAREVMAEQKVKLNYLVGTMIEVPRGAWTAEFFSFGTNDLTQTSRSRGRVADDRRRAARATHRRDDSGSFLPLYTEAEIVKKNPFASINQTGVGQRVNNAVQKGNASRPAIKLGTCLPPACADHADRAGRCCGEPGGDPDSVKFSHRIGLTYVSCSPFRVPVARLAATQAASLPRPTTLRRRQALEEEAAKAAAQEAGEEEAGAYSWA